MNPKAHIFITFLFSLLLTGTQAQYGAQKRADYYFGQFQYSKAIREYEKMVDGNFNMDYAHQRLAECYLLIRDFKNALPHFEKVIHKNSIPKDYYFKYGMALYSDGQLDEAATWLKKYKKYNKNDSRVNRFLKDGNLASVVFNSRERYEVSPVAFNSTESDFGSFVNGEYLYFASSRKDLVEGDEYGWNEEPWLDILVVKEGAKDHTPVRIQGDINTRFHESSLVFSTDYKNDTVVYFTRNNYFKNKKAYGAEEELNLKIFSAIKEKGVWKENRNLKINSDYFSTGHPYVSPGRTRLYFTSDRPGGYGGTDIYYADIHPRGGIGKPVNAGPIVNTEGDEMFPFVNNEGVLFFASDGHVGFGLLDIFSTISNDSGEIVEVVNLGTPVNSPSDDFAYYSDEDGITGYLSSNREGGMGSDDIYRFKFTPELSLEGIVLDGVNLQPLDSVKVAIYNQKDGLLEGEAFTDINGYYRMYINRDRNYVIEASRKTHPIKNVYFNTYTTPLTTKIIAQNITLDPVMDVKLLANLNKIYFDFNKSDIRPDAARELDKVVKLMTVTYPDMIIHLEAHTDPIGSHEYNDDLSERRARSTYDYLIQHGVPKEHILSYKGFGKRRLINHCTGRENCTDEELELNRRTEFPIVQIKKPKELFVKNK